MNNVGDSRRDYELKRVRYERRDSKVNLMGQSHDDRSPQLCLESRRVGLLQLEIAAILVDAISIG